MFVKSLKMAGFKSFASPTVLEFEPGVNVIVGPNGSGKSNISDALSWVLGSQAPSSLRGGSMEDVIFAGSETRSRLGIAEVELLLDNASGVLPLDLSEVRISRSTDRAGASEYRINGAPCRLLDILELLSDTGVGRSIHTVVGQGQLDAVLQARPEDRRTFIEEAAQIGKYRRRKDRALRKLERVDDNLMRLNDVLTELRRGIRPLKRQANAAAVYSELVGEHRELRQRLAATEITRLAGEETALDIASEEQRTQLLTDELDGTRARLETAAGERDELAHAAEEQQRVAHLAGRAADRLASLGKLAEERAGRISARLAAETEEGYRERIRLLETERDRWSSEAGSLRSTATDVLARADRSQRDAAAAREAQAAAERELYDARSAETLAAQELVRAEGREAAGANTLGSLEARVAAAQERREVRERELTDDARAVDAAAKEVESLERDLDRVTELAAAAETELEERRERVEQLKDALNASHSERAAARARMQVLQEVTELLGDLLQAKDRIEPLLTRAREEAEIATSNESDARVIVEKADDEVEAAWQIVAKHDAELRRLDALMNGAAERLGGRRRKREAREIELAALDEELSRVRDALAQAQREATEERAALPARRAALRSAEEIREQADRVLAGARRRADELVAGAGDAAVEARTAEERADAATLRLEEAETGISEAQAALAGLAELRSTLQRQRDRAEAVAEAARFGAHHAARWTGEAEARAERARERAHRAESQLNSLRERERELERNLSEASRKKNQAEVKRAQMLARTEAIGERAMDEWGLSVEALAALEPLDDQSEGEAIERVGKLERELKRLGPVNPRAAEEYREAAEREQFLIDQMEDLQSSKRDLMKIVRDVDQTIVEVFGTAFEDVAREFEDVFTRLFPGGSGALKLTEPDDLLNSGIEVEARPPGKNVRKLSLLSGGERSLVALAFLFAIFRSRPSPFYLLDEVEAALDDVNLLRFLGLIHELEERAQVMIVTHQKRTMEAADVLYGVTMKEGISSVVAKRIEDVEGVARAARA